MIKDDDDIQDYVRPWVGLTDDEISLIVAECSLVSPSDHYFAQAIEQALKERNT